MSRSPLLLVCALGVFGIAGCDDPPKPGAASAAPSVAAAPTTAPTAAPKPTTMPDLSVDPEGPYLGGQRVNLADANGPEKLVKIVKDLPINGSPVTLRVDKKAKVSAVAAVIVALGDAGAPKVTVKTEGRSDLPKILELTPESRVPSAPGCAIVATVLKDFSTAVWPFKGGLARKQRKGLAGPESVPHQRAAREGPGRVRLDGGLLFGGRRRGLGVGVQPGRHGPQLGQEKEGRHARPPPRGARRRPGRDAGQALNGCGAASNS